MRVKTFLIRYKQTQAEVIREFVERVEVFQPARVGGRKVQRLRIVWNCIGEFTPPQP
jgi:site-specific DNA recombinase